MGAVLADRCLLGNKTRSTLPNGIFWAQVWPLFSIATLSPGQTAHDSR